MLYLLGVLVGMGLPVQTSWNARLRLRLGTPIRATLLSFSVGTAFLTGSLVITGQWGFLHGANLLEEPFWIWTGGVIAAAFIAGNIALMHKLGSVETAVLPAVGQILMGLLVDQWGLFHMDVTPLTPMRLTGGLLAAFGVFLVAGSFPPTPGRKEKSGGNLWIWRAVGFLLGALMGLQLAINAYLGHVVGTALGASAISFSISVGFLILLVAAETLRFGPPADRKKGGPWWMWVGGIPGASYLLVNIILSNRIGVGMTVVVLLTGVAAGSVLIDQFGLFCSEKKKVTAAKVCGLVLLLLGTGLIRLF